MPRLRREDLPEFVSELTDAQKGLKRAFIRKQLQNIVTAPHQYKITCGCGKKVVFWMMYRCLYCGEFYCKSCAEFHFGMRVPDTCAFTG